MQITQIIKRSVAEFMRPLFSLPRWVVGHLARLLLVGWFIYLAVEFYLLIGQAPEPTPYTSWDVLSALVVLAATAYVALIAGREHLRDSQDRLAQIIGARVTVIEPNEGESDRWLVLGLDDEERAILVSLDDKRDVMYYPADALLTQDAEMRKKKKEKLNGK